MNSVPLTRLSTLVPSPTQTSTLQTAGGSSPDPAMLLVVVLSCHRASMLCVFESLDMFLSSIPDIFPRQRRHRNDPDLRSRCSRHSVLQTSFWSFIVRHCLYVRM